MTTTGPAVAVDDTLLRAWPLPEPDEKGDKESRGRVLVVAGSREIPGAALLAATAALRAGAGKLVIASPACVAPMLAAAMPEARVIALPEAGDGLHLDGIELLATMAQSTAALLVGPGMAQCDTNVPFLLRLLPLFREATVVLDAVAMDCAHALPHFEQPAIFTPHAGEMAHLTRLAKEDVQERALEVAAQQAAAWGAVVALKGAATHVAHPDGRAWRHASRTPGLGTSGSGDVLAGIIAGLAARGAAPEQATVWGVALHARAGDRLAELTGSVGYLARELPAQVPALMHGLSG